jgi:hypothetical protein
MRTRDIVIVMAVFYAIIIPASVIFMLYTEQEEKKHGLEIIMDKTVYKKGEIVEYTVKNNYEYEVLFPGLPIHTIYGDNLHIDCCHLEIIGTINAGETRNSSIITNSFQPGEYMIKIKDVTMNFTIIE